MANDDQPPFNNFTFSSKFFFFSKTKKVLYTKIKDKLYIKCKKQIWQVKLKTSIEQKVKALSGTKNYIYLIKMLYKNLHTYIVFVLWKNKKI